MAGSSVRFFEGCKFLWDGEEYASRQAAEQKKRGYEADGFETQVVEEEGRALLYTRRVVKQVVVESGSAPA